MIQKHMINFTLKLQIYFYISFIILDKKMEKEGAQKNKFDPQKYDEFAQWLMKNKKEMFNFLQKSIPVGAYANQTKAQWDNFYQFYITFLKSEIGPRGECARKVRSQLLKNQEHVNKLLVPFKMTAATHIKQIYMKIKSFVPCEEYTELKKVEEAISRMMSTIEKFNIEDGPMVKTISEGLIKKNGPDFDIKSQLALLKANYVGKLKQAMQSKNSLEEVVNKCESYQQLVDAEKYLTPYFKIWKSSESDMGKENSKTGQVFEQKVVESLLPYLIFKEQNIPNWYFQEHQLVVFTNLAWIPRNLGQIDIAFGFKNVKENRFFITTLVECKSRLFDVREAHKQVSLQHQGDIHQGLSFEEMKLNKKMKFQAQLKKEEEKLEEKAQQKVQKIEEIEKQKVENMKDENEKEVKLEEKVPVLLHKKFLSTRYGPAQLVPNHRFYIVTTLPKRSFTLPIESKMKETIERLTKNMFVEDIQSQPLYEQTKQKFKDVPSPLAWLTQYESQFTEKQSNIIVLK